MFYYNDQSHTPSFPVALIKMESGSIVRTVETNLGRLTLVVAAISIDAYPLLPFSDFTCHLDNTEG